MYHVIDIDRRLHLQVDFAAGRELDRVVQKIEQNLPYPGDVADHGDAIRGSIQALISSPLPNAIGANISMA